MSPRGRCGIEDRRRLRRPVGCWPGDTASASECSTRLSCVRREGRHGVRERLRPRSFAVGAGGGGRHRSRGGPNRDRGRNRLTAWVQWFWVHPFCCHRDPSQPEPPVRRSYMGVRRSASLAPGALHGADRSPNSTQLPFWTMPGPRAATRGPRGMPRNHNGRCEGDGVWSCLPRADTTPMAGRRTWPESDHDWLQ